MTVLRYYLENKKINIFPTVFQKIWFRGFVSKVLKIILEFGTHSIDLEDDKKLHKQSLKICMINI